MDPRQRRMPRPERRRAPHGRAPPQLAWRFGSTGSSIGPALSHAAWASEGATTTECVLSLPWSYGANGQAGHAWWSPDGADPRIPANAVHPTASAKPLESGAVDAEIAGSGADPSRHQPEPVQGLRLRPLRAWRTLLPPRPSLLRDRLRPAPRPDRRAPCPSDGQASRSRRGADHGLSGRTRPGGRHPLQQHRPPWQAVPPRPRHRPPRSRSRHFAPR